ncbi:Phosphoribosyl-dephospho-CoA transferase [plant metagenome]|uniref:Phosphoribosyl-dephospho-CoA transferase n=1 Tax=plant metagenome TaxID=1297885 RepID=A0A484PRJ9_9ZZZZ
MMPAASGPLVVARHDLVWLDAGAREALTTPLRAVGNEGDADALATWLVHGRPFVVSRQPDGWRGGVEALGPSSDWLAAGVPLPPAEGRRRLGARLSWADVRAHRAPLSLYELAESPLLPPGRSVALDRLARALETLSVTPRVFGSAAMQALTGMAYLRPDSDLDLLWRPVDAAQCLAVTEVLLRWQEEEGWPVDGEMLFGEDDAVSWREWQRAASGSDGQVLVKSLRSARLVSRAALMEQVTA